MAGYGFSGKPTAPGGIRAHGACLDRVDETPWVQKFTAQGGDWGAFVTNEMAQQAPPELLGIQ